MKIRSLLSLSLIAVFAAVGLRAQSASLSSDTTVLAPSGGNVTLRAVADYEGEPGALGRDQWSPRS
ncbi:MAG: hypothetical protein RLZZ188_2981 [Verrucomicrobiota bacterium]